MTEKKIINTRTRLTALNMVCNLLRSCQFDTRLTYAVRDDLMSHCDLTEVDSYHCTGPAEQEIKALLKQIKARKKILNGNKTFY